ncbi:MAG: hypothetical protein ACUZ8E_04995 [Candidatus Anammoxibacter sp.]
MTEKKGISKVEFKELRDGSVEVCYFDQDKHASSQAWVLPTSVAEELISWWKKLNKENGIHPPIKERYASCEITVHTENYIDIEEFFTSGSPKKNFWTLTMDTVEELVNWAEKNTS